MEIHLGKLFESIKEKLSIRESIKKNIAASITEATGISIEEKDITIKNYRIYLRVSPIMKSEIMMKKKEILEGCKNKTKEEYFDIQ